MVIAQPVLERQSVKQTAMHLIAMKNVVAAVPAPVNGDELAIRAQRIRQAPREHRQRFDVEVVSDLAEDNEVERASPRMRIKISAQIATLEAYVVQACAAYAGRLNSGL